MTQNMMGRAPLKIALSYLNDINKGTGFFFKTDLALAQTYPYIPSVSTRTL